MLNECHAHGLTFHWSNGIPRLILHEEGESYEVLQATLWNALPCITEECVTDGCDAQEVADQTIDSAAAERALTRTDAMRTGSSHEANPDPEQVILAHNLPKQPTRTNVVTQDQTPRTRITLGALAWLIGLGTYTGGRLWYECPTGAYPPPVTKHEWQKTLRDDYVDVNHKWHCFDGNQYHAVEPVTSGKRISLTLFTPRGMKRLSDHQLQDLDELGFPVSKITINEATPELLPDEVVIDIPGDDEVAPGLPEPIPTPGLSPDVWYQGEWELPDPYLVAVDQFTHDAHLDEVGVTVSDGGIPPLTADEEWELQEHIRGEDTEFEGYPIGEKRVRRIHTDRARELTSAFLENFLTRYPQVLHTHTRGYEPQANGTAERGVGMIKTLELRSLTHSKLPREFWSFAALYAAQSLLCKALQRKQCSPPFGSTVIATRLKPAIQSFILTTNPADKGNHYIDTAGYPIPSSPDVPGEVVTPVGPEDDDDWIAPPVEEDVPPDPPASEEVGPWKARLREDVPVEPLELDHLDYVILNKVVEDDLFILSAANAEETPRQIKEELVDQSITTPLSDIRASQGPIREKWIQASQKEMDSLISSQTVSAITLQDRDALKLKCKKLGWQYSELPCKGVFTIKPDKYKARICGCGNFESRTLM
eukprot:4989806-Amphidinium_carterae.1